LLVSWTSRFVERPRWFGFAIASTPGLDVDALRGSVEVRLDKLAAETTKLAVETESDQIRMSALRELRSIEDQRAKLLGLNIRPGA